MPFVDVLPFADATAYDIIRADALVIEQSALGGELPEATDAAEPAASAKPRRRAASAAKAKVKPKSKAGPPRPARRPRRKAKSAKRAAPTKKRSE